MARVARLQEEYEASVQKKADLEQQAIDTYMSIHMSVYTHVYTHVSRQAIDSQKQLDRAGLLVRSQMPKRMSKHMPKHMSKRMSKHMPKHMSKRMSKHMPKHMPKQMSKRMPKHMPKHMSKRMSEHMPKHMSKHMSPHSGLSTEKVQWLKTVRTLEKEQDKIEGNTLLGASLV